jgi:hypothetical protein
MLGLKARRAVAQRWVSARRAFGPNLLTTHRMIGYRWSNVGFFWSLAPTNDEQLSLFFSTQCDLKMDQLAVGRRRRGGLALPKRLALPVALAPQSTNRDFHRQEALVYASVQR